METKILVPVLVGLITILFVHRLILYRGKIKIFNDESKKFTDSFKPDLEIFFGNINHFRIKGRIRTTPNALTKSIEDALSESFGKQRIAMIEFSRILNGRQKKRLNSAWNKYCIAKKQNKKELIVKTIRELFEIAKYK